MVGVSPTLLWNRLYEDPDLEPRRLKQPRKPRASKLSEAQLDFALEAYAKGATSNEAAALVGVTATTVLRRVHEQAVVVLKERCRRAGTLSAKDREEIRVGIERGESDAAIAARLGRHRGTIWREIRANGGRGAYRAYAAEGRAQEAARRPKMPWTEAKPELWAQVQVLLRTKKWAPQPIAKRLRRDHPDEPQWWVSHEAIYQAIFVQAKGGLRKGAGGLSQVGAGPSAGRIDAAAGQRLARSSAWSTSPNGRRGGGPGRARALGG